MINYLFNKIKQKYEVLNRVEISSNRLIENYNYLSSLNPSLKIAPVLKSNAYGHGIIEVGKILDSLNAPFFCVDSLYEAYELQKAKAKTPILIMGYTNPKNLMVKRLPFIWAVWDLECAKVLNKYQKGSSVHIFIDTGMNREGVKIKELEEFLDQLTLLKNLKVEGLMTHFASINNIHDHIFLNQRQNFKQAKEIINSRGIKCKWFHAGGSGFTFDQKLIDMVSEDFNLLRTGRAIYGIGQNSKSELKPVFKLISHIVRIKDVEKGEYVGYDGMFKAKDKTKIAVLPIGYFDGVDRRLSNRGVVKVKDTYCPVVGLVSMNMTTIDISGVNNPEIGMETIIYSDETSDKNSSLEVSKLLNTTPSEILSSLTPSTRRIVV